MAFVKRVNVNDGSGRVFEENTVAELQFDLVPEAGSFNAVTSDGVYKALEVATEIPVVTSEAAGRVLTASWNAETSTGSTSWEEAQGGAEYTAGDGIEISDSNAISAKIGDGLTTDDSGALAVNHDETLTEVGGPQPVTPDLAYASSNYSGKSQAWHWYAYSFEASVPYGGVTFNLPHYKEFGNSDYYGKQVVAVVSKPGDPSKFVVGALEDSEDNRVFLDSIGRLPAGTYNAAPRGTGVYHSGGGADDISDVIVDGKVIFSLGFRDQSAGTLMTNPDATGPAYNGVPMQLWDLADIYVSGPEGDTPIEPGPDAEWNWYGGDPITQTIGSATKQLSVANPLPSVDGHTGEFLKAGSNGPEWDTVDIPSYTAGDGIKIESGTVSAYHGETLVDKALPLAFKTGADSRNNWINGWNQQWHTALKVSFGNIVPNDTLLKISIKNSTSSQDVSLAMPYTTADPDLGGKKVKLVFANPDNPSNYIEALSASNVEITQSYSTQYSVYTAKVSAPAVLFDNNFQSGFNWNGLTLADIQGADGTTLMYAVACASDGTLITTGSYGPTNSLWTVGFGNGYLPSATTYALVTMPSNPVGFDVANPVPSTSGVPNNSVLAMGNSGMEWVAGGVPSYLEITTGTASIGRDNSVVTSTADVTSIIVGAGVKSAVVQWVVNSTTTLPTVTDGTNALKASVNNPASLTVGRTVQVSILNGTWVCAEFA